MLQVSKKTGLADYFRLNRDIGIACSKKGKFIYMKPAKTAGTSILRFFLQKEFDDIINHKTDKDKMDCWLDEITDTELENYFIFTVTRNPWDRFVSISSYLGYEFEDFCQNLKTYTKDPRIKRHTLPISNYTHIGNVQFADFICRFESLQSDMNLVMDKIKTPRRKLPFYNESKHDYYGSYYNSKNINLIRNLYQNDIKNFGYEYEDQKKSAKEYIFMNLARKIYYKIFKKHL